MLCISCSVEKGGEGMQSIHFFAGSNTARGFYSCFENILPADMRRRMFFIKGGPGVGKSTLMRRVGAYAEEKGLKAIYFHCSSDPDSLDGVCLPERGIGLMDATAPHVYDPVIPGARDTLLSLGDHLDEKALAPHAGEIIDIQQRISARFARCYRYLAAAEQVFLSSPLGMMDEPKAAQLADDWARTLPLRGGTGRIVRLFASAFTPKGFLNLTDFSQMERRITLELPFGAHATGLMQLIAHRAAARGLDVVELCDPLSPAETAHVLIPAHGVAFCTAQRAPEGGEFLEADAAFRLIAGSEHEQSFDRNAYELLCQRAVEQLMGAKALHDELEKCYVRNMDFAAWEKKLAQVLDII